MEDIINAIVLILNFLFVPAVAYGCQLALGALGVTLVYGILRFSNFAHGETMSFGTMVCLLTMWWMQKQGISIAPLPTVLLALPIGIVGTVFFCLMADRWVYKFYRRQKSQPIVFLIASIGLMFFMNGIIRFGIGTDDRVVSDGARFLINAREFKRATGLSEGLAIKTSQSITIVVTLILVASLFWFLKRTRAGKSMRAYSDNEDLALLSGINPERVVMITWILTGAVATIAGALYGLDKSYKPFTYLQLLLPIFAAAIVGGFGNPVGAIAGGFIVAFSEISVTFAYRKFVAYIVPGNWEPEGLVQLLSTDYKFAVSFMILVLVLLFRPNGLFNGRAL